MGNESSAHWKKKKKKKKKKRRRRRKEEIQTLSEIKTIKTWYVHTNINTNTLLPRLTYILYIYIIYIYIYIYIYI